MAPEDKEQEINLNAALLSVPSETRTDIPSLPTHSTEIFIVSHSLGLLTWNKQCACIKGLALEQSTAFKVQRSMHH